MAKRLISILDLRFSLPTGDSRINVLSYPEIHLMALLLVGTRICFPFEGSALNFYVDGQQALPAFDWASWHSAMGDACDSKGSALDLSNVKPGQVAVMNDDELKDYFEHVSSFIEKRSEYHFLAKGGERAILTCRRREPVDAILPLRCCHHIG